jgi:ribosome-associated protein
MVIPSWRGAILPGITRADKFSWKRYAFASTRGVMQPMEDSEFDDPEAPSKSRRKRDMLALQKLGEELLAFPVATLQDMGLPEPLFEAIETARRIKAHGGRRRQLQYIGKLMRNLDTASIREAIASRRQQQSTHTRAFHRLEGLREALIDDADAALAVVFEEFPAADRQHLRRLARQARTERDNHQPPRAARVLFRYLRDLQEQSNLNGNGTRTRD